MHLKELEQAIWATKDNPDQVNLHAIANIWRVFIMHRITDLYGDVPYTEAGQGFITKDYTPRYDKQSFIYPDMLAKLETAIGQLDASKSSYGASDVIFQGNLGKWKTFAYSLMLRLGMRLTNIDENLSKEWVQKAIAGGVMQSNADVAKLNHAPGKRPTRQGRWLVTAFDYEQAKNLPITQYGEVSKETLWKNLEYFLKAVVPEAEKAGIKLAMHPDDPQVDSIRGISRIMTKPEAFRRMLRIYPSDSNGITMCQGNFALMGADIPALIHEFGKAKKIHFVHFRNVRGGKFSFEETFHDENIIDMYQAMKAYYDIGFKGAIRPDHVPTMAGDSNDFPGYSIIGTLYALGYIRGLMEAVSKEKQ